MGAPTVPFYGRDADRLANVSIAIKVIREFQDFTVNWPSTVANVDVLEERKNVYESSYHDSVHGDRRYIAQRIEACNLVGVTWQKIVNYACSTEQDHSEMLAQMGVTVEKPRRSASANTRADLPTPDFMVVNVDKKGGVRASCPRDRRRYNYEIWVTEGDPRADDGWFFKQSYGDCTQMDMDGYQSGKEYSFRCRIIGRDNATGPWSHVITLMVT